MQASLFVQTVQTSVLATGSTSKGHGGLGNSTINQSPTSNHNFANQPPPPSSHSPCESLEC